jgi:hypothetical protein
MRKIILVLMVSLGMVLAPMASVMADCVGDLAACEELMAECDGAECPDIQDCEEVCKEKCGWVALVKDKTFIAAVLGGVVFLVGGIAGIFIPAPGQ